LELLRDSSTPAIEVVVAAAVGLAVGGGALISIASRSHGHPKGEGAVSSTFWREVVAKKSIEGGSGRSKTSRGGGVTRNTEEVVRKMRHEAVVHSA
jgi:hypothetical protein